ncbi:hypothetical protein AB6813_04435, partial [bacterium RCC_150]
RRPTTKTAAAPENQSGPAADRWIKAKASLVREARQMWTDRLCVDITAGPAHEGEAATGAPRRPQAAQGIYSDAFQIAA